MKYYERAYHYLTGWYTKKKTQRKPTHHKTYLQARSEDRESFEYSITYNQTTNKNDLVSTD